MKNAYVLAAATVGKAVELYGSPQAREIFREIENHSSPSCDLRALRSRALLEEDTAWAGYEDGTNSIKRWFVARALVSMINGLIRNRASYLLEAKTYAVEALYGREK